AEESRADEPELAKLELDKLVLVKLEPEVGFDHVKLPGRIGFSHGCSLKDYGFLDSCFGSESSDFDCFGFDFGLDLVVQDNCMNDSLADYDYLEIGKNCLGRLPQHIRSECFQRWLDNH
nr:hypothetical protein [Tanacetum cinerariifolium]